MSSAPSLTENFSINKLRSPVLSGETRSLSWRRLQFRRFDVLLKKHETEILQALKTDLGKPTNEAFFEIVALKQELQVAQKNIEQWMRPRRIKVPLPLQPGDAQVQLDPLG